MLSQLYYTTAQPQGLQPVAAVYSQQISPRCKHLSFKPASESRKL